VNGVVAYYVLVLIIVLPVAVCSLILRLCWRKWRRDGYLFRAPRKPERKSEASESSSALTGPVELSSGGLHEPGELAGGGHLDKVELMAVERPRELSASNGLDDVSQDISTGERERRKISMGISAC
jgi:hypothetical protein